MQYGNNMRRAPDAVITRQKHLSIARQWDVGHGVFKHQHVVLAFPPSPADALCWRQALWWRQKEHEDFRTLVYTRMSNAGKDASKRLISEAVTQASLEQLFILPDAAILGCVSESKQQ